MINFILIIVIVNYLQASCKLSRSNFNILQQNLLDVILILIIFNIVESSNQSSVIMENIESSHKKVLKKDIEVENLYHTKIRPFKKLNKQKESNNNNNIFIEPMLVIKPLKQDENKIINQVNNNDFLKTEQHIWVDDMKENQEQEQVVAVAQAVAQEVVEVVEAVEAVEAVEVVKKDIEVGDLCHPELKFFIKLNQQKEFNNIFIELMLPIKTVKQDENEKIIQVNSNDFLKIEEPILVDDRKENRELEKHEKKEEVVKRDIEVENLYHPELKSLIKLNQQKEFNNIFIELMLPIKTVKQDENEKISQDNNNDFLKIEEHILVDDMEESQEQEEVETIIELSDNLKQFEQVKEESNLNQIADMIKQDYKGVTISTLVSNLGIVTGEVIFNIKDVVALKLSNNIIVFINSNAVSSFL